MIQGIDVSHYSGIVNWPDMKASGVEFMFAKATEGQNYVDKSFYTNWNVAKDCGIVTGAYHFFHPGQDAKLQWHLFMYTLGKLRVGDLPPVLDLEVTNNMAPDFIKHQALNWLDPVEQELGVTPIIYSSLSFLESLGDLSAFLRFPLWIAHYGVKEPTIPKPWTKCAFWQYAEKPMDLDYFNGSVDDLKDFVVK